MEIPSLTRYQEERKSCPPNRYACTYKVSYKLSEAYNMHIHLPIIDDITLVCAADRKSVVHILNILNGYIVYELI